MIELYAKTKILLAVALAMGGAAVGTTVYYVEMVKDPEVAVPDFTGKTKTDVESWAKENRVSSSRYSFSYEFDETIAEDGVLSQSIPAGEMLGRENVLEVVLSSGKDPDASLTFPDLSTMSREEIEKWFEDNGFTNVSYAFAEDDSVEAGSFLKASVEAGAQVKRSDAITVTFATGGDGADTEITVPDFSTYSYKNMQAWGLTNGVTIKFVNEPSSTVAKGAYISQSVKAGTTVKAGSTITITLSSGKATDVVNYVGKTKKEADAWISNNGLKAVYREIYSTSDAGMIVSQNPSSGTVSSGGSVTFEVSVGKVDVTDFTGKTKTDLDNFVSATNAKYNSSAKLTVSYKEVESDQAAGTILSQSVSGLVNPGTAISAEVAVGKKVTVTSYAGKSLDSFRSYLSSLGLSLGNVSYAYSDSVASGNLISNDTGTYSAGASINCRVSNGAYTWDPGSAAKAGQSWSSLYAASATARANGYSLTKTDVESSTVAEGLMVSDCSISGKTIACQVSIGKYVTVDNVVGKDKDAAQSLLQNAGLSVTLVEQPEYSDTPAGQIIGQSIAAGTKVKASTAITLTYSKGPEPVVTGTIPNFPFNSLYVGATNQNEKMIGYMTSELNKAGFYNISFVKSTSSPSYGFVSMKTADGADVNPGDSLNVKAQIVVTYGEPSNG